MPSKPTPPSPTVGQAPPEGSGDRREAHPDRADLRVVLSLTFINSLGTGAVTNGVFFIASQSHGFDRSDNFLLGVVIGVSYIAGALGVGPLLTRLIRASAAATHRRALALLTVLLGVLCLLPWLASSGDASHAGGEWALWVFVACYSPLTGALWPIVEAYVAGGRGPDDLRRATSRFNLCWASAIPIAYWGMAPLLKEQPLWTLNVLGALHLLSLPAVAMLPRTPARHAEAHNAAAATHERRLLALCRVLLPMSYLVFSVWSPYQPAAISALGVPIVWQAPLAATWHLCRVAVFAVLEWLPGWHGRWWLPIWGAIAMVVGLIGSIAAPGIGPGVGGIALLVVSLAAFGTGIGAIYAAALYYAMSVGRAEVDAGGKHEALIGVGYTLGPGLGLGVAGLSAAPWGPGEDSFAPVLMGSVLVLCLLVGAWAAWWVPRAARRATDEDPSRRGERL